MPSPDDEVDWEDLEVMPDSEGASPSTAALLPSSSQQQQRQSAFIGTDGLATDYGQPSSFFVEQDGDPSRASAAVRHAPPHPTFLHPALPPLAQQLLPTVTAATTSFAPSHNTTMGPPGGTAFFGQGISMPFVARQQATYDARRAAAAAGSVGDGVVPMSGGSSRSAQLQVDYANSMPSIARPRPNAALARSASAVGETIVKLEDDETGPAAASMRISYPSLAASWSGVAPVHALQSGPSSSMLLRRQSETDLASGHTFAQYPPLPTDSLHSLASPFSQTSLVSPLSAAAAASGTPSSLVGGSTSVPRYSWDGSNMGMLPLQVQEFHARPPDTGSAEDVIGGQRYPYTDHRTM
jgi:hypothetical protein